MMKEEPFFEGIESDRFREEVLKYATKEEFTQNYELSNWVDTSDLAELGIIKVSDIDLEAILTYNSTIDDLDQEVKSLMEQIKSGQPIPPIVVEKSEIMRGLDLLNRDKGFFLRHGENQALALHHLEVEYIPAIVYDSTIFSLTRNFDNTLSMGEFLDIDFDLLYQQMLSKSTESKQSSEDTLQLLSGSYYFELHPEDELGEPYETTNQFNRKVRKLKGTLASAIEQLNWENDKEDIPEFASVLDSSALPSLSTLMQSTQAQQNVLKVIKSSRSPRRKKKNHIIQAGSHDLLSFEEMVEELNEQLTEDEIKAWVWYQRKSGAYLDETTILNFKNPWSNYIIPLAQIDRHLQGWLEKGIICCSGDSYLPSSLYYAGNIYDKEADLLRQKESILQKHGEDQFNRQLEGLRKVKPPRLTLTNKVVGKRLSIKPISSFAENFKIKELQDGTRFTNHSKNQYNKEYIEVHLGRAFAKWLRNFPKEDFEKSTAYDIINYYLLNTNPGRNYDKESRQRLKQYAKHEGELLFGKFLAEGLKKEDQQRLELIWNRQFNGYVPINYFKIPVGFECSSTFKNKPLFIRPTQREGIGHLAIHGSGCIAYDVGVGKTMTGILSIAQALQSGQCKRPLIVVPNQTYKNWIAEISGKMDKKGNVELTGVLPQYPVIDLYNLGEKYLASLINDGGELEMVPEKSISIVTYEGLRQLGFRDDTWNEIRDSLFNILNQGKDNSKRAESALQEKAEELMGIGYRGSKVNIEDLGFDFLLIDEAHAFKKIFTQVKGEINSEGKRERSRYQISSGTPSSLALKGFMIANFIQKINKQKNLVLLTATPFTNSPLEIYSMLTLIAAHRLREFDIYGITNFFNHFIKSSMELTINAKMQPERKEVVKGFDNLIALQKLIFQFIDYKTGEQANIQRPNKVVLPLTHKVEGDQIIPLPIDQQVSTNLPMTLEQKEMMKQVESYVAGDLTFEDMCSNPLGQEETIDENTHAESVDEDELSDEEMEGAKVLRGITLARQIAFSPYLFSCHSFNPENLNYKTFVESSPKLQYVMGCIKSVKDNHLKHKEEMSGQVIYTNAGVSFFPLIKEYLVKELGFEPDEVGMIKGGMTAKKKEREKERFLSGEMKVLLGSQSIKEGINLQARATVLYNLWLDWNPTDLKQLEGRIWRFGNQYANVRIVIPLMEDSIDTAIFQKLEEKTNRINEIWHRSGQENSLKLDEFNPAELKMGLITDPKILAKITLMEEREILLDEMNGLKNQLEQLNEIISAKNNFDNSFDYIDKKVEDYKPLKKGQTPRKIETILNLFRTFLNDPDVHSGYIDNQKYDTARSAHNILKRGLERILQPRGLDLDFKKEEVVGKIEEEITMVEKRLEKKTGDEALSKLTLEIIKEREERGYKPKTVLERVQEFANLNPSLLSNKMEYQINSHPARNRKPTIQQNEDALLAEMEALLEEVNMWSDDEAQAA